MRVRWDEKLTPRLHTTKYNHKFVGKLKLSQQTTSAAALVLEEHKIKT